MAELRRTISLPLLTLYGLGTILGAGIYVLIGEVAVAAGYHAPFAFLVSCVLAVLTGLSYGELSARFPESAGEAAFVDAGFSRPWLSTLVGVLITATGVISAAAITVGFSNYVRVFADIPAQVPTVALIVVLSGVAIWGIKESLTVAALMTLLEVGGLLLVIVVAGDTLSDVPQRMDELLPSLDASVWQGVALGAFIAFYAFIGFEDIVNIAEEVHAPETTIPRAIILCIAISSVFYVIVALVCTMALGPAELGRSDAPLAHVYQQATGRSPVLITAISLVAVANGALVQIVMGSRVLYGLSRRGWLPEILGRVSQRTNTPVFATAIISALILVLAVSIPLSVLAQLAAFVILGVFALVNLSLWRLKGRQPHPPRGRGVPRWVPLLGMVANTAMLLFRIAMLL